VTLTANTGTPAADAPDRPAYINDFERRMHELAASAGTTPEEIERIKAGILALAEPPAFVPPGAPDRGRPADVYGELDGRAPEPPRPGEPGYENWAERHINRLGGDDG
jgi:hypothetical protein